MLLPVTPTMIDLAAGYHLPDACLAAADETGFGMIGSDDPGACAPDQKPTTPAESAWVAACRHKLEDLRQPFHPNPGGLGVGADHSRCSGSPCGNLGNRQVSKMVPIGSLGLRDDSDNQATRLKKRLLDQG